MNSQSATIHEVHRDAWQEAIFFVAFTTVLALVPGGSYAEYVAVDATTVMRKPRSMSWAEAASVPEAWLTASLNLRLANVSPGETVLIHAAASGVGVASVQLARAAGARVLVTVGSAAKLELAQSLGASGGALRHDGPWLEAVRAAAPGGKVDAVLDCVAGAYAEQNVEALGVDGRLVSGLSSLNRSRSPTLSLSC